MFIVFQNSISYSPPEPFISYNKVLYTTLALPLDQVFILYINSESFHA